MTTDYDKLIEQEKAEAKQICSINGDGSPQCAAAWDAVEEVQAAASHVQSKEKKPNSLQSYCADNPDAIECRIYED
ncbi:Calvin cycle protein CP12 [Gloeobacter kilaueensis]|uniref:Putative CP12 gene family protein n=1 Tax=Gloeobacter kilaueensis (strain ATCC BAA-2537 / CCAP 1431/1 / ULC 316 / JS1) TaxID=1183438 RepID=U5QD06_GLOK1|nr:Calvin cycle protein CP12 [Gloeobacter kilaueensis]AGY56733.1 putative CP12 gene family protein [Gloeobacter kilaueensis JS1]